jgi:hypothetical protein
MRGPAEETPTDSWTCRAGIPPGCGLSLTGTGGVARSSLDHRLMAVIPPGWLMLTVRSRVTNEWQVLGKAQSGLPQSKGFAHLQENSLVLPMFLPLSQPLTLTPIGIRSSSRRLLGLRAACCRFRLSAACCLLPEGGGCAPMESVRGCSPFKRWVCAAGCLTESDSPL